ncbi:hypothetical protein LSH36_55g09087, partial [Paralvinella palmiformis]
LQLNLCLRCFVSSVHFVSCYFVICVMKRPPGDECCANYSQEGDPFPSV